jgi:tetratricopeptide (TPR) repeat protein
MLLTQGDLEEAGKIVDTLIQTQPTSSRIWFLKSNLERRRGDLDAAIACLEICVALAEPERALRQRAVLYLLDNNHAAAEADLTRVIERQPDDPENYLNRGLARMGGEKFADAEEDFSRAIELGTSETRVYFLRSRVRMSLNNRAGAKEDFTLGLELKPLDSLSYLARGVAQVRNAPEKAIADFEEALRLDPTSIEALQNLAHTYSERKHDHATAVEYLERIVDIRPDDADTRATIAVLLARDGQNDKALQYVQDAEKRQTSPELNYRIAGVYALLSREQSSYVDEAIKRLKIAARGNPLNVLNDSRVDPDLKPIRESEAFLQLINSLESLCK